MARYVRGTCICGNLQEYKGLFKGKRIYGRRCTTCRRTGHRQFKKDHCEKCGFIAIHTCQLDVDHIDGNNKNNDISNLQTLCANCHRLKTYINKDHIYTKNIVVD